MYDYAELVAPSADIEPTQVVCDPRSVISSAIIMSHEAAGRNLIIELDELQPSPVAS
jgi:hypothetical protein